MTLQTAQSYFDWIVLLEHPIGSLWSAGCKCLRKLILKKAYGGKLSLMTKVAELIVRDRVSHFGKKVLKTKSDEHTARLSSLFLIPNVRMVTLGTVVLGAAAAVVGSFAFLRKAQPGW
jgi:hypothetical protein